MLKQAAFFCFRPKHFSPWMGNKAQMWRWVRQTCTWRRPSKGLASSCWIYLTWAHYELMHTPHYQEESFMKIACTGVCLGLLILGMICLYCSFCNIKHLKTESSFPPFPPYLPKILNLLHPMFGVRARTVSVHVRHISLHVKGGEREEGHTSGAITGLSGIFMPFSLVLIPQDQVLLGR